MYLALESNINKDRHTQRERKTKRDRNKAQGVVLYLFSFKGDSLEKARSQLAKFCLSKNLKYSF